MPSKTNHLLRRGDGASLGKAASVPHPQTHQGVSSAQQSWTWLLSREDDGDTQETITLPAAQQATAGKTLAAHWQLPLQLLESRVVGWERHFQGQGQQPLLV